jgi:choline dehydrogenase
MGRDQEPGRLEGDYDFIVVGAGSAGCVVAARLATEGRHRVLLLEAGPRDRSPWIHLPIGYGKLFYHPDLNWMYRTEPVPGLGGRSIYQPRGKVVGGSSAINAMVYSRGQREDYEGWAKAGNPGWDWPDVLACYRRLEDHGLGPGDWHGTGGPLAVADIADRVHPLTRRFIEAARETGLRYTSDLNGPDAEGVGFYQLTVKSGLRMSAARAWLKPALKTGLIRLETGALACRVLLDGRKATGVAFRRNGHELHARARREVILCGGAINSPQLLQLSGIGPSGMLAELGIPVSLDSPRVGRHFQDHLCYDHVYRSTRPSLNDDLLSLAGRVKAGLSYSLARRGPLALSVNQGGGFIRSRPEEARPDLQLYFSPLTYERAPPGSRPLMRPDPFPGFSTSVSPCRPASEGHVRIRSADPAEPPVIEPNYLASEVDLERLLAGARFLRQLADTPTMRDLIADELRPGPACVTDDDLVRDIRERAYSVFHPCGTCRMGPEPGGAVVDPWLRVHGLERLRVADASIFPTVPSGNTNAPAMMVGMRAADMLLQEHR